MSDAQAKYAPSGDAASAVLFSVPSSWKTCTQSRVFMSHTNTRPSPAVDTTRESTWVVGGASAREGVLGRAAEKGIVVRACASIRGACQASNRGLQARGPVTRASGRARTPRRVHVFGIAGEANVANDTSNGQIRNPLLRLAPRTPTARATERQGRRQ